MHSQRTCSQGLLCICTTETLLWLAGLKGRRKPAKWCTYASWCDLNNFIFFALWKLVYRLEKCSSAVNLSTCNVSAFFPFNTVTLCGNIECISWIHSNLMFQFTNPYIPKCTYIQSISSLAGCPKFSKKALTVPNQTHRSAISSQGNCSSQKLLIMICRALATLEKGHCCLRLNEVQCQY